MLLKICRTPFPEYNANNHVYLNCKQDFKTKFIVIMSYVFAFSIIHDQDDSCIALNSIQRGFLNLEIGETKAVKFIDRITAPTILLSRISFEMIGKETQTIKSDDLTNFLKKKFQNAPLNQNQVFLLNYANLRFKATVTELISTTDKPYGTLIDVSNVIIESVDSKLSIIGAKKVNIILNNDYDFESFGIGGLKNEFSIMYRRVFVQRLYSVDVIKKLGIPHVKGIILYGPPGTGKTLIARRLGSILDAKPPKIVNGPEILNSYFGKSEENVRLLFKDAEDDFSKHKENSPLHIIIFDEIDAICKSRGATNNEIGDRIVNQLLSKMDGVEAVDNVLVVGMTNRLDLIDRALLRPGRFEIQIETTLPDEKSRIEIFTIHTKEMKRNNFLNENVDLCKLAKMTKNFTGAEICAVVKSAASYALEREVKGVSKNQPEMSQESSKNHESSNQYYVKDINHEADINNTEKEKIDITMNDFNLALKEIKPSFGTKEEDFAGFNKVYYELPSLKESFLFGQSFIDKLRLKKPPKTLSLLFHGKPGTGKTRVAIKTALNSNFPFVIMIAPQNMVGFDEKQKINYIKDRFMEAYKSEESIIILDEIESIIDYVAVGPRFSSSILHCLKIFIKNEEKNKVFVIGTTSEYDIISVLGVLDCFDANCLIDLVRKDDFEALCKQNDNFKNANFEKPLSLKNLINQLE